MPPTLGMENLPLYQDLLVTLIKARMTMDTASARADLLLNIFLVNLESLGTEKSFVSRTINNLEMELLDARDAPKRLQDATAERVATELDTLQPVKSGTCELVQCTR